MTPGISNGLLLVSTWLQWTIRFGWIGVIAIGIADASLLPLPGSLDLLTIVLCARNQQLWLLFAAAAWVGSVVGGYLTFKIGQKGGKELLEKKVPKRSLRRVSRWMEEHSYLALFFPPLLPPPTPVSYFVLAAGAMQVSARTFFLSFGTSRAIRYLLLAYFGRKYGHQMIVWARTNYTYVLAVLLALAVVGGAVAGIWWYGRSVDRKRPNAAA
jgi:membrane protein DedA with SNARE-associated domain